MEIYELIRISLNIVRYLATFCVIWKAIWRFANITAKVNFKISPWHV